MWRNKSLWIGEFCYDEFVLLLGKIENKCPEKHVNQDPQPRSADFNQAQETTEPPQLWHCWGVQAQADFFNAKYAFLVSLSVKGRLLLDFKGLWRTDSFVFGDLFIPFAFAVCLRRLASVSGDRCHARPRARFLSVRLGLKTIPSTWAFLLEERKLAMSDVLVVLRMASSNLRANEVTTLFTDPTTWLFFRPVTTHFLFGSTRTFGRGPFPHPNYIDWRRFALARAEGWLFYIFQCNQWLCSSGSSCHAHPCRHWQQSFPFQLLKSWMKNDIYKLCRGIPWGREKIEIFCLVLSMCKVWALRSYISLHC